MDSRYGAGFAGRSALSIYYDMEGLYPTQMTALTNSGKYMSALPSARAPNYHADSSSVRQYNGGCGPSFAAMDDFSVGGWAYCAFSGDPLFGTVAVNCTHTDSKGSTWTFY